MFSQYDQNAAIERPDNPPIPKSSLAGIVESRKVNPIAKPISWPPIIPNAHRLKALFGRTERKN